MPNILLFVEEIDDVSEYLPLSVDDEVVLAVYEMKLGSRVEGTILLAAPQGYNAIAVAVDDAGGSL